MLPAEKLRLLISKLYNINLEQYAWSKDFKDIVFAIELDEDLESTAKTLEEIYQYGFNIGHCGLTSRYLTRRFGDAKLHYGFAKLLKGTKAAPNGEHAWITINNFLIDTTLMICIPTDKIEEFGYETQKTIANKNARILSEYDIFDNDFKDLINNPNFQDELCRLSK